MTEDSHGVGCLWKIFLKYIDDECLVLLFEIDQGLGYSIVDDDDDLMSETDSMARGKGKEMG